MNNRKKFTLKKMQEIFTTIVDKYVPEFPSQVQLKLPKLKKMGSDNKELPKIKLPKLKKEKVQI